jgi:uncharacterized membrane-anchored protein
VFIAGIYLQLRARRYRAFAYWFFAYAIAVFGTAVLAAVFWLWHRNEGTLSIHSITTRRREYYYWSTVFATFALGTALGDYTAVALRLGYLPSGIAFCVLILVPAIAWWKFGLNAVAAFWFAYVLTRPLGASFADYISKPRHLGGVGFGDGPTTAVLTAAVGLLVFYLSFARPDIQTGKDIAPDLEG